MNESLQQKVMDAIERGEVRMRPRWQFMAYSAFAIVGGLLVFLTAVYIVSLVVFFLEHSGAWFAPSFGGRGWLSLLYALPRLLIALVAIFAILLYILVRRYRFVYQKPLVVSLVAIFAISVVGGIVLSFTPLHNSMYFYARHGQLPPPFTMWYRGPMHVPDADVYRGVVASTSEGRLYLVDEDSGGETTVFITPNTRLPYGAEFPEGSVIVVIGDAMGTDTVQAFGIRKILEKFDGEFEQKVDVKYER